MDGYFWPPPTCADSWNRGGGLDVPPGGGIAAAGGVQYGPCRWYTSRPCAMHVGYHTICLDCFSTHLLELYFASPPPIMGTGFGPPPNPEYGISNLERVRKLPMTNNTHSPPLGLGAPIPAIYAPPDPPWGGFLARVCEGCERIIQSQRYHSVIPPRHFKGEALFSAMCTCSWSLGLISGPPGGREPPRLCRQHLHEEWQRITRTKDRNDKWLRNIALDHSGRLVRADRRRLRKRNETGSWRACRCGREITRSPGAQDEAYICMACEEYVSVVDPTSPGSRYSNTGVGIRLYPHRFIRSVRAERLRKFKLNRPLADGRILEL